MGCDIHGRVQYRYSPESSWFDGGPIENGRNYTLFSVLAGVRAYDDISISDPRGYPDDFVVDDNDDIELGYDDEKHKYWMGDHSHSWLMVDEIVNWPRWDESIHHGSTLKDNCRNFWLWLDWIRARNRPWGDSNIRIVFGFDS